MTIPQLHPKVERLQETTNELEGDMRDVKERLIKVELTVKNTDSKVDDIHKWAGWFFKTIIGAILVTLVGIVFTLLL